MSQLKDMLAYLLLSLAQLFFFTLDKWDASQDTRVPDMRGGMQVTTSDGDAYNVATEISTEVYNQIASWYNEDGDSAGNGTLPLAPSGPGSQPTKQNSFVRFWTDNWGKAYFVAGVVIVGIIVLGMPPSQDPKHAASKRFAILNATGEDTCASHSKGKKTSIGFEV